MPRKARIDAPGALHHVIVRGIERRKIFRSDYDYDCKNFLNHLRKLIPETQTVKARSLLCFWAHRKLGMTTIEIGKKLNISQSAVSRSSMRGQQIERENRFELIDQNA
jgi:hypothetical protein